MLDTPKEQLRQFLATLFEPTDIVEIRPIEIWWDHTIGRRRSKMFRGERRWLTGPDILKGYESLLELNVERCANIFMGVSPALARRRIEQT